MSKQVMHGWQAIAGGRGEVYITDEETGEREIAIWATKVDARVKINTADVDRLGATMVGKKELGSSGEGSLEGHANTSLFAKMALRFKETGVMPRFTIQITNDDPGAGIGRQTTIVKHCLFSDLPIANIDAGEEILKVSSDYSFEAYECPELFSKLNA